MVLKNNETEERLDHHGSVWTDGPMNVFTGALVAMLVFSSLAAASDTGAVTGRVLDARGGPVIGAAVLVEGTDFGSMTDARGGFYIPRLSPGDYSITARMVGMASSTVHGVTVVSGRDTNLEITLRDEAAGATVITVTGQRNLILESVPSTIHVVDREEIETMPVSGIIDVIQRQAGVSVQGGEIHVRGGRSGEVAFLLDGVSVRSPVTNSYVASVPLSAIAEASTITGGFGAEYGNALSGVVKMVVREGGPRLQGEVETGYGSNTAFGYESGERNYDSQWENDDFRGRCLEGRVSLGGPEPITSTVLPVLGIRLPGEMRFFAALERTGSGFNLKDSRGFWDNNWQHNLSGCLNLSYRPDPSTGVSYLGRYSYRQSGWDEWAWSRLDRPAYVEGIPYLGENADFALPIRFDETWGVTAGLSRLLGESDLLEVSLDRSEFCQWRRIRSEGGGYLGEGLTPAAWFGEFFPERVEDSLGFFHHGIHSSVWLDSRSSVWTMKADLTNQLGRMLKLKTGIEGSLFDIYDFSVFSGAQGETWVNIWKARPFSGAAYVQTTANFSGAMVLETGLRLDAFYPNTDMVMPGGGVSSRVPAKTQLSPRFGVTHPISDRDVFFASYGRYFQMPTLNQMFSGTSYNLSGDYSIVGNPDLEAVRTISYEAGVRHRINELSTLSVSAFYKQITGLVQTSPLAGEGQEFFFMYENDESYATVQGAEITVIRLPGRFLSGSLGYTYSIAEGRYSSAVDQYRYSAEGYGIIPVDDNYLDWDRRHSAQAHIGLTTGTGEGPVVLGTRPFESTGVTLSWMWGSGLPFSPASTGAYPLINTMRLPWTMQTDLGFSRRFRTALGELQAELTVFNLFDRKNIERVFDPGIYAAGGDPGGTMSNPAAFSSARHVFMSLGVRW